jgi:uncharacterized protein HemX
MRNAALWAGLALASALIAGCNQHQQQKTAQPNAAQQESAGRGHHGLRAACSEDIQKFCANEQRKRRCLRDNMDKLSDTCKAALAERHGGRKNKAGDNGTNNDND